MIRERAGEQMAEQTRVWMDELRPQLAAEGIRFLDAADYTPAIDAWLTEYFETQVFPVLTPLAFDPGHPFPFISNLSMNLAVRVRHGGRIKFARVKVPGMLPRLVPLPAGLVAPRRARRSSSSRTSSAATCARSSRARRSKARTSSASSATPTW